MSARITKAEVAFLMPPPRSPTAEKIDALREAAARAQAAALKASVHGFFNWLGEKLLGWPARARAIAELRGLSDRDLADLGLTRGEIEAAVIGRRR
jgi:uncharacterized protein YjiS (DUF1127 family)